MYHPGLTNQQGEPAHIGMRAPNQTGTGVWVVSVHEDVHGASKGATIALDRTALKIFITRLIELL